MKKLPPGEAERRHKERKRIANDKRKTERMNRLIGNGTLEANTTLDQYNAYMADYMRKRRAKHREENPDLYAKKPKKVGNPSETILKRRAAQAAYRERKKAERIALGIVKVDKRTKEGRSDKHWKQKLAPKPAAKPPKPQKPAHAPQPRKKLKQQAERIRITAIPISERVPLKIPEINATVYLRNGETAAACRERYLNRAGNKISKW